MRDFLNSRSKALKPSGIRKYFDIVEHMPDAISLGVGEPDFVTPWEVRSAGIRSLQRGFTQYTGNRGLQELRTLIARYLKERFSVEYSPSTSSSRWGRARVSILLSARSAISAMRS